MRELFPGYYRLSENELVELWQNGIFVFDANVLLNLYRYPTDVRGDLLRVLDKISGRVWLPHQAALEYQENRLTVIAEQLKRFTEVRKVLDISWSSLETGLNNLQLGKRHSSIRPDVFLNKVGKVFATFQKTLASLEEKQPKVFEEDEVRVELDSLFHGKVGAPFSQSELDEAYKQGKTRYEHHIPPGYEDTGKGQHGAKDGSAHVSNGMVIRREYGDLLLWLEIIKEVKAQAWKGIIFVTDDDKEDWWWTVESEGKKTIGPRPELIDELAREGGVRLFCMYNSERFLQYARQYLGAQVETKSIDKVREISELRRTEAALDTEESHSRYWRWAKRSVIDWLIERHGKIHLTSGPFFPDIIVLRTDRSKIGYEVKVASTPESIGAILKSVYPKARDALAHHAFEGITLVLVARGELTMERATEELEHHRAEWMSGISVQVGSVQNRRNKDGIMVHNFVPYSGIQDRSMGVSS
jgi:hypothetical protein